MNYAGLLFITSETLVVYVHVMNAAAKVITCKRKFDHVTPLLIELHWLPVRQRIVFKVLLYTLKALHGATPTYLTELISPYVPRRVLRSADQPSTGAANAQAQIDWLEGFLSVRAFPLELAFI